MKNKVFLAILMASMAATSTYAATSQNTTTEIANTASSTKNIGVGKTSNEQAPQGMGTQLAENQSLILGKVSTITKNQITFFEGTQDMSMGGMAMENGATPPELPSDAGQGQPPALLAEGQGGEGVGMGGQPGGGMNVTWGTTTQTLTLSSQLKITKMGGQDNNVALTYTQIKPEDQVRMIVEKGTDGIETVVSIEIMGAMTGGEPMTNSDTGKIEGTAAYTVDGKTASQINKTYAATKADQSAVKVINGGNVTLSGATLTKTGNSSDESESNFYGLNAAVVATKNSTITIKDSKITTYAEGANAIFATQEGSKINVSNVTILTKANSSRGLDATYGGTITASNVNITTKGAHCAALATDRGEGTVSLTGGTLNTAGDGSPCIYSTGNISATNVTGTSTGAQAAVIEGKNSITLKDATLTGAGKCGVMLYQSFSGDASVGTSVFNMTDGKLTATAGPIFYVTNTDAIANLKNVDLVGTGALISAGVDRWGTEGSNGGHLTFNADSQILEGTITANEISTVAINLKNTSKLSSTINADQKAQSISLSLDQSSTWNVTGDSYLSILKNEDTTCANIEDNGHNVYYDSTQTDNAWLNGQTIILKDGGKLMPIA